MDLELSGLTAVVTGASRGIGRACAEAFAREGADVVLAARDMESLEVAAKELRARYGVRATAVAGDLTDPADQAALVECSGDFDVWVNNAGAAQPGGLASLDDAALRESLELKLFGYLSLCRLVLPHLEDRRSGVLLNVIGGASLRPHPEYIAGTTANSALHAVTKALGGRSLKRGVRVVGVNPGLIATDRLENSHREVAAARLGDRERWPEVRAKLPEPGRPEQVADVVVFLCSARASHVSGEVVAVDGGHTSSITLAAS